MNDENYRLKVDFLRVSQKEAMTTLIRTLDIFVARTNSLNETLDMFEDAQDQDDDDETHKLAILYGIELANFVGFIGLLNEFVDKNKHNFADVKSRYDGYITNNDWDEGVVESLNLIARVKDEDCS